MPKDIFIGYADLETMLTGQPKTQPPSADFPAGVKGRPLYVMLLEQPGKMDKHGVAVNDLALVIQDIAPQGVRYCRLSLASVSTIGGKPFSEDTHKEKWERAQSAYKIVRAWLAEQGYTVEEATIAHPRGYVFLNGWASFLKYDKDSDRFVRAEASDDDSRAAP